MKNDESVMLLAEDALLREGLRHLLLNLFPEVTICTTKELHCNLFTRQLSLSCLVIVPSSPFLFNLLPRVSIQWPTTRVIMLCPRYAIHYWACQAQRHAVRTIPLQLPVPELMWELSCAMKSRETMPPSFHQAHQRWLGDRLLSQVLTLTPSEARVLYLLLREYPPVTVGRITSRSVRTISAHKIRAMEKLAVSHNIGLHELVSHPSFLPALELELLRKAMPIPAEFYQDGRRPWC